MIMQQQPRHFTRREWLQLGAGAITALAAGTAGAAESTGRWNDQNIAEYTQKLFDWLKANFAQRAETLRVEAGSVFNLEYDYMGPTEDKKRLRVFEKFAKGRLSDSAAEKHIQSCLSEFERIRTALAAAEAVAAQAWKAKTGDMLAKEGTIYDTRVSAERLTVVLDSSHSMRPYLPKLRDEISGSFSNAYFVEVDGCKLTRPAEVPWFYSKPTPVANPFSAERHIPKVPTLEERPHSSFIRWTRDAPAALVCMADLMKTDAIYWFCDFDDPTDDRVIKEIARKMIGQKVAIYIHTLDKRTPKLLATLAEKSGGKVVRKRI